MSSTTPYWSSTKTQSPTRIGWVTASMIPAMKFASVWRAAKPRMAAAIAPEASSEAASSLSAVNSASAKAHPMSDDDRVEDPAQEAQPRVGLLGELPADDRGGECRAAAPEQPVEHEHDEQGAEDVGGRDDPLLAGRLRLFHGGRG